MALGDLVASLAADPGTSDLESIKQRQLLAQQLMQQGSAGTPIQSPWQGLNRLAQGLIGGYQAGQAQHDQRDWTQAGNAAFARALNPTAAVQATPSAATASDAPTLPAFAGGSNNVAMPGYASSADPAATEAYIRQRAPAYGIDPDTAVKVASSEGLKSYTGDSGSSFGPFQLHYGGMAQGGNSVAGLGDDFTKATGLDARDPRTVQAQIDYALAHASKNGWGAFHGAANSGIDNFAGIGQPQQGGAPVQVASNNPAQAMALAAPAVSTPAASAIAAVAPATNQPISVPGYDGKFTRDQANDSEGVPSQAEWDAAAKAAGTGAAAAAPPQAAAAPVAPKPAVDPRGAQLLAAMADPHITPAQRQVLGLLYSNIKNQEQWSPPAKDADGNLISRNLQNGETKILVQAKGDDKTPQSVLEYQYAQKNGFKGSFQDWKQSGASGNVPATVQEYQFYLKNLKPDEKPIAYADFRNKTNTGASASADPILIDSLATRAIEGDATWKTGLARVPGLISSVETEVARRGKDMPGGSNASTILQNRANQVGRVQEQRTLGSATASNTLYGNAAASTIDTAIQASRDVPRSSWLPVNKILQGGEKAMSDPKLGAFVAATNTLVNDYAKATTPVGTPTDSQRHHAEDMLNTAQSPEVYEAVANMMRREIANTHGAIDLTKEQLRSGQPAHFPASNLPPAGSSVPGSQSQGVWDTIKGAFGGGASAPAAGTKRMRYDAQGNPVPQ